MHQRLVGKRPEWNRYHNCMTFRDQEWGSGGDVEYYTTDHAELAEFYSDATTIKDVTSIKTTSTMVGGTVCVYGRSSNVRTCNHRR